MFDSNFLTMMKLPKLFLPLFLLLLTVQDLAAQTDSLKTDTVVKHQHQRLVAYAIPAAFVAYGFLTPHVKIFSKLDINTNAELREDHPGFNMPVDNYLRYAPVLAVYALDLAGVHAKHNFVDRTAMLFIAGAIMSTSVTLTKQETNRIRPSGAVHSFPSGHTAMAFMTAEFMHQEYKDEYPLISYLGYVSASATGVLRLYNNAHWVSDVVAGAGYGMISAKLAYLVYPFMKRQLTKVFKSDIAMVPVFQSGYCGLVLHHQIK